MPIVLNDGQDYEYGGGSGVGAVIFDSSADALAYHLQNMKEIEAVRAKKAAQAELDKKAAQNALSDIKVNTSTAWNVDQPVITAKQKELIDYSAEALKAGADINDPAYYTQWQEVQKRKQDLAAMVASSKQGQELYKKALEEYEKDPTKYDKKTIENLRLFATPGLTAENRNALAPNLLVPKKKDYLNDIHKSIIADLKPEKTSVETPGGAYDVTIETNKVKPERIASHIQARLNSNDEERDWALEEYAALPEDIQIQYADKAAKWNKEHPKEIPITPEGMKVYEQSKQFAVGDYLKKIAASPYGLQNSAYGLAHKQEQDMVKPNLEEWSKLNEQAKAGELNGVTTNHSFLGMKLGEFQLSPEDYKILAQKNPKLLDKIKAKSVGGALNPAIENQIIAIKGENGSLKVQTTKSLIDQALNSISTGRESGVKVDPFQPIKAEGSDGWEDATDNVWKYLSANAMAQYGQKGPVLQQLYMNTANLYKDDEGNPGWQQGANLNTKAIYKGTSTKPEAKSTTTKTVTKTYTYNGKPMKFADIEEAAKLSGVSTEEYIKKVGIK